MTNRTNAKMKKSVQNRPPENDLLEERARSSEVRRMMGESGDSDPEKSAEAVIGQEVQEMIAQDAGSWDYVQETDDAVQKMPLEAETFAREVEKHLVKKPQRPRRRRRRSWKKALAHVILEAAVVLMLFLLLPFCCVRYQVNAEVGENCPELKHFLRWDSHFAHFVSNAYENASLSKLGDYGVVIRVYGRNVASVIHVQDSAAPQVKTKDIVFYMTKKTDDIPKPEDFIEEIVDATETTVRYGKEPDCTKEGTQQVLLIVEDAGGNVTKVKASLEVVIDREPPKISGVKEITMVAGASVSYKKGVTVTDNCDDKVKLNVDTSAVDTNTVGDYEIVYTAVDASGNEASETTMLHVTPLTLETVSEDTVNAKADELLAKILTDSMSEYEKAEAIYWWCHDNISYSDGTPKTNWMEGAYHGIVEHKGDCYTYAATAKCLLTRAGIKNMDIERIPEGNAMHYWNLIDLGEGWYHFDTCRRADGATFFYKTDAEIKAYSDRHRGTHNYDRSLYPEIQ